MNKKKKSTNISPYPDEVIDRLARAFYPAILACWNSEEGQREFAAWQAEQVHHTPSKEKQSVPDGERPVVHIVIVCGLWQGASYSGAHPVFCFALNLLAHGFQPHSSNISPGHRSESDRHSPAGHYRRDSLTPTSAPWSRPAHPPNLVISLRSMTRYRSFAPSTGAFIVVPEENEKSEPFSNRKQVRIFLVWWARVDSNHRS